MYFAKIINNHTPNNRLKTYVSKQIKALECNAVEDPEAFKKHLEGLVSRANYRFPRCKPLVSYLHNRYGREDYNAGISEVVEFALYKQQAVFGVTAPQPTLVAPEGTQAVMFS